MAELRLYDNTRVSEYKRCPRKFFFRHILHLVPKGTRLPLVFGAAWHKGMEVIWGCIGKDISLEKLTGAAYAAFLEEWESSGLPAQLTYEQEKELSPRTPGRAYEMFAGYVHDRWERLQEMTVVAIEHPFMVPLDPDDPTLFYVGKIDKLVLYKSKYLGIEHKTTTAYAKNGGFRTLFLESFSPNAQVDGYQYALHMLFPGQAGGIWVDAALVHKGEEAFHFIPVDKQVRYLDSWLWDTRSWINRIEDDRKRLSQATPEDPYLAAFPKNTNSCWDFNSACEYHDICRSWANPLGRNVPEEYDISPWDPLNEVKGLKELLEGKDGVSS